MVLIIILSKIHFLFLVFGSRFFFFSVYERLKLFNQMNLFSMIYVLRIRPYLYHFYIKLFMFWLNMYLIQNGEKWKNKMYAQLLLYIFECILYQFQY